MPRAQKELKFFSHNYSTGWEWYAGHFPSRTEASRYRAIGEVTPGYMFHPEVPSRIKAHLPDCKFIAILRHPVDRAFSQYTRALRNKNLRISFPDFLSANPDAFQRGLYGEQLGRFLEYFPKRQFAVLLFEKLMVDQERYLKTLAEFLDVDPDGFDTRLASDRVNVSYLPRYPALYTSAVRVHRYLLRHNWNFLVRGARDLGMNRIFKVMGTRAPLPRLDAETRRRMFDQYAADADHLQELFDLDLSVWRSEGTSPV